ncbi:MAG: hypothetical protein ABIR32_07235 [Ilumatobacteraceae bacterium]
MGVIAVGGLAAVVIILTIALAGRRSDPSAAEVAWLAGPGFSNTATSVNDDARAVCRRYLTRHRRHRFAGGVFGVCFAAIIGVRWFGSITIGVGQGNPLADLLFCGVGGVIVGTLSAESFRLTTTRNEQRAASLTPRPTSASRGRVLVSRFIALASIVIGVAVALTDHGRLALFTSMIFVVPLAMAELVMVVIASRSRPAMTDRARLLDERLRAFAGSSLTSLHLATAVLMLGWTSSKIDGLTGFLAGFRFCVVVGCLVMSVISLRRAAPRPSGKFHFGDGATIA